jgi:hypothetical protein
MFVRKDLNGSRPDLFVSAKTRSAIPARHPAVRQVLVQCSLDPAVRCIDYATSAHVASQPVKLDAIVLRRDDGSYHLDIVPARLLRTLDDEGAALIALAELGLKPLVITAGEIRREPRYANSQIVWSYNGQCVPTGLRMRILEVLFEDGPMSFGRLLQSISSDRDPTPAVLALACADALELDLISRPLGPLTMVRSRG